MKRSQYTGPRPGRNRGQNVGKSRHAWFRNEGDIDLLSVAPEALNRGMLSNGGRRPSIRTGARIRMDAPSSTISSDRDRPVPSAPKYRKNARPTNLKTIVLATFAGVIAIAGLTWLLTTPKLDIRNIQIDGVSSATASSILSSIHSNPVGHNMFAYLAIHGKTLQREVTATRPDFASATIGVRLPGTLTIQILDRKPFALLSAGAGESWILDDRGIPILPGAGHPKWLTKIFVKPDPSGAPFDPVLGKPLPALQAAQVSDAYALMAALKSPQSSPDVHLIQVDNSQNLGLNMNNNLLVKLGQSTQLSRKLVLVGLILNQHPDFQNEAQYIDVSNPGFPAMMPRASGPGTAAQSLTGTKAGQAGAGA